MESEAVDHIGGVRGDGEAEEARRPRPETPALIDMDNAEAFRPVPVCFN
ncbi:MAG TPA: hypothetical protein PL086_12255 [Candidatus Aminicenantes bacterium]|nr:MAG: hypothetical protein BWX98_01362 [Candidatus Aminicenantes bacterium ADurb.Bin147]HPH45211.1 hypothetical protein [Candidatus Aminicenantes bacterium]